MKKHYTQSYFFALTLGLLNICCTKKSGTTSGSTPVISTPPVSPPPSIQVTEYLIDLLFGNNADCVIDNETRNGSTQNNLTYFTLSGTSISVVDTVPEMKILVQQTCHRPTNTYHRAAIFVYEQTTGVPPLTNSFEMEIIPPGYNFFTLPYNSGPALFSGTTTIIAGKGKYINIRKTNLNFSGFADTTNHTGSIRFQGSIFY